jgi:hypothetical protein
MKLAPPPPRRLTRWHVLTVSLLLLRPAEGQ